MHLPPPIPTVLPFPAIGDNRENLQRYLLDHYASSTFNICEHQLLPLKEGPPLELMIDQGVVPIVYHTPIPIPIHWQDEVKAGLNRDVKLGVIEPVPFNDPGKWCHHMVICPKKNGQLRRTINQNLNTYTTRDTHHSLHFIKCELFHTVRKKTVSDAWNGYHIVPLRKEDRAYTTFITPWGRYCNCTLPQGYTSAGDGYSRRFDVVVLDVPNKIKVINDALLCEDNLEKSFFQACKNIPTFAFET